VLRHGKLDGSVSEIKIQFCGSGASDSSKFEREMDILRWIEYIHWSNTESVSDWVFGFQTL